MRFATLSLGAALAVGMLFSGWALAQNDPPNDKTATLKPSQERVTILRNFVVKNTKGEELGRVRDFMIDARSGQVLYAAVGHGGTLGIGEKYIAVPLSALKIEANKDRPAERYFVLDAQKSTIDNHPGFNTQDWPTSPDPLFIKEAATPPAQAKVQARRANVLIGMAARNAAAENLGTLRDLVLDVANANVIYAAVGHGGGVLAAEKLVAVPWNACTVRTLTGRAADECVVIDVAKSVFDSNPGFNANHWPADGDHTMFKQAPR